MEEEKHVQEKSSDSHADASGCSLPARHQRSGCCPDRFHYRSDYHPVDYSVDHPVDHPVDYTVGTSTTTFSPAKACTRAEMIEFVWNAAGQQKAATTKAVPFTDVPESGSSAFWYEDALLWAYEKGIAAGTGDGSTFDPNATCTRAEAAAFIQRQLKGEMKDGMSFTDVSDGDWFYEDVLGAWSKGVAIGTSTTTFSPLKTCTRAEVVEMLHNVFAK